MTDPFDLARFVAAQEHADTYACALEELRDGHKRTHWMWFVFPQIAGLGQSPTARRYAIASLEEAVAYLRHPVLGARLVDVAAVLTGHAGRSAPEILGGVDAAKLRSSMTLFARAAAADGDAGRGEVFTAVLQRFFDGEEDPETLRRL